MVRNGEGQSSHVPVFCGSGGVAILVKDYLLQSYQVRLVDKSQNGIIGIELKS